MEGSRVRGPSSTSYEGATERIPARDQCASPVLLLAALRHGGEPHCETPASHISRAPARRNPSAMMLKRSETDRVIGGVAGGIAQRLGLSSTLVRLAWVVSILFGGFGVLAYLILWIVLPKGTPHSSATRVAEERYARGEITAAELDRIRGDLQVAP
jgi:phage shock protein C